MGWDGDVPRRVRRKDDVGVDDVKVEDEEVGALEGVDVLLVEELPVLVWEVGALVVEVDVVVVGEGVDVVLQLVGEGHVQLTDSGTGTG